MEVHLQFAAAMTHIGQPLYTKEVACEMLAWLRVLGGHTEAVVLNNGLNFALRVCAQQLGIEGGKTPDKDGVILMKAKIAELDRCLKLGDDLPAWCRRIIRRYDLKEPRACYDYCFGFGPGGTCEVIACQKGA